MAAHERATAATARNDAPHAPIASHESTAGAAPSPNRGALALLALATLCAAALRLPFLATQSFWFDETYTVHVVRAGSLGALWDRIGATESTPPLFYLLTWGWTKLAGSHGEAVLRTIPALATIAAVPVAYAALRRLVGARAALAAAAIVAVSPLLVSYALDARAYGLLVLTGLLSVWACAAALEAPTPRRRALWALAAVAAVWTHWFAGFLVLGEVIALLWLRPAARRAMLLAAGGVLLAIAPLAPLLHRQTGDDRAAFIAGGGLGTRIEQLARQFAAGPNVPRTWLEAACLALALGGLAVGAALTLRQARADAVSMASADAVATGATSSGRTRVPPHDGARALLTIALVALLIPLALAATGAYDRFNLRNVLFLLPLAAALAAPVLLRLRAASLATYLALCTLTAVWVQTDWRYENTDWRGALRRASAAAPGLPIVAVTPLGQPVAALYLHSTPATAPLMTRRAWLVIEPARTPGHRSLEPQDPPPVAALLAAFPAHREQRLHGFRLIELTAPEPVPLDAARLPGPKLFGP